MPSDPAGGPDVGIKIPPSCTRGTKRAPVGPKGAAFLKKNAGLDFEAIEAGRGRGGWCKAGSDPFEGRGSARNPLSES
jgi:hypothetical protein